MILQLHIVNLSYDTETGMFGAIARAFAPREAVEGRGAGRTIQEAVAAAVKAVIADPAVQKEKS